MTCEGTIVTDAAVYTSPDEKYVLVYLKQAQELYLINLSKHEISVPNRSNFVVRPGFVFSRQSPPPRAPMGKAEIDPQLVFENESVEFTSLKHSRLKLGLKSL